MDKVFLSRKYVILLVKYKIVRTFTVNAVHICDVTVETVP